MQVFVPPPRQKKGIFNSIKTAVHLSGASGRFVKMILVSAVP